MLREMTCSSGGFSTRKALQKLETRDYKAVTSDGHEILLEGTTKEYSYCLAIRVHSQCWEPWAWTHTAEETRADKMIIDEIAQKEEKEK